MSIKPTQHVLLTGAPGVGKTTLIRKVCDILKSNGRNVHGFYTEELRNDANERCGFDVVTLDGQRGKLSRVMYFTITRSVCSPVIKNSSKLAGTSCSPQVLKCLPFRFLPRFDFDYAEECGEQATTIGLLLQCGGGGVLVLDEIGKMELFSNQFQTKVEEAFGRTDITILATVPILKGTQRIPVVESLIANPKCDLITMDRDNRDSINLLQGIVSQLAVA